MNMQDIGEKIDQLIIQVTELKSVRSYEVELRKKNAEDTQYIRQTDLPEIRKDIVSLKISAGIIGFIAGLSPFMVELAFVFWAKK